MSIEEEEILQAGAQCIEEALLRDESVTVTTDEFIMSSMQSMNPYGREQNTLQWKALKDWPQSNSTTAMGYFDLLHCSWKVNGPSLLIWSNNSGSNDVGVQTGGQMIEYRTGDQDIVCCEVVRPKSFLAAQTEYLLVVCTVSEVTLHAIKPDGMQISRTNYVISTDDVRMTQICGDPKSRRIFLGAQNGGVYEFKYFEEEKNTASMFLKRPRLAEKSTIRGTGFRMPAFIQNLFTKPDAPVSKEFEVRQMLMDTRRDLLWVLRKDGIHLFEVSDKEVSYHRDYPCRDIFANLRRYNLPSMLPCCHGSSTNARNFPGVVWVDPAKKLVKKRRQGMSRTDAPNREGAASMEGTNMQSNEGAAGGVNSDNDPHAFNAGGIIDDRDDRFDGFNTEKLKGYMTVSRASNSIVKLFTMPRAVGWEQQLEIEQRQQLMKAMGNVSNKPQNFGYDCKEYAMMAVCRDGTRIFFRANFRLNIVINPGNTSANNSIPNIPNGFKMSPNGYLIGPNGQSVAPGTINNPNFNNPNFNNNSNNPNFNGPDLKNSNIFDDKSRVKFLNCVLKSLKIAHAMSPPPHVLTHPYFPNQYIPFMVNDAYVFQNTTIMCIRPAIKLNLIEVREDEIQQSIIQNSQDTPDQDQAGMTDDGVPISVRTPAAGNMPTSMENNVLGPGGSSSIPSPNHNNSGRTASDYGAVRNDLEQALEGAPSPGGLDVNQMSVAASVLNNVKVTTAAASGRNHYRAIFGSSSFMYWTPEELANEDDESYCTRLLVISMDMRLMTQRLSTRTPWQARGLPTERYDVIPITPRKNAVHVQAVGEIHPGYDSTFSSVDGGTATILYDNASLSGGNGSGNLPQINTAGTPGNMFTSNQGGSSSTRNSLIPEIPEQYQDTSGTNAGFRYCPSDYRPVQYPFSQYGAITEMAQQQALPSRNFYVLTNNGLLQFSQNRCGEEFLKTLAQWDMVRDSLDNPSNNVAAFFRQYTTEEALALCFQIIAGASNLDTSVLSSSMVSASSNRFIGENLMLGNGSFPGQILNGDVMALTNGSPSPKKRQNTLIGTNIDGEPQSFNMIARQQGPTNIYGQQIPGITSGGNNSPMSGGSMNAMTAMSAVQPNQMNSADLTFMADNRRAAASSSQENNTPFANSTGAKRQTFSEIGASGYGGSSSSSAQPKKLTLTSSFTALSQRPPSSQEMMSRFGTGTDVAIRPNTNDIAYGMIDPSSIDPITGGVLNNTSAAYQPGLSAAVNASEYLLFVTEAAMKTGGLVQFDGPGHQKPGFQENTGQYGIALPKQLQLQLKETSRSRALCLYASRLLRPFWLTKIVVQGKPVIVKKRAGNSTATGIVDAVISGVTGKKRKREEDEGPAKGTDEIYYPYYVTWTREERLWLERELRGILQVLRRANACNLQFVPGGELQIFQGVLTIVERTLDVLQLLNLLADRLKQTVHSNDPNLLNKYVGENSSNAPPSHLERRIVVADKSRSTRVVDLSPLSELVFRDLVRGDLGQGKVKQLLRTAPTFLDCTFLAKLCPHLLSSSAADVLAAHEILRIQNLQAAHAEHAINLLKKNLGSLDMQETGPLLRQAGCVRALIEIGVRKCKEIDPRDEAGNNQHLHFSRVSIYQIIYAALNDIYQVAQPFLSEPGCNPINASCMAGTTQIIGASRQNTQLISNSNKSRNMPLVPLLIPGSLTPAQAAMQLEKLIVFSLDIKDRLFQCGLFKLLLQWEVPIWELNSPFLADFLQSRRSVTPELLCKYYHANGRWKEAIEEYKAVSCIAWPPTYPHMMPTQTPVYTLWERIGFLQTANALAGNFPDLKASVQQLLTQGYCQLAALEEIENLEAAGNATLYEGAREVQATILDLPSLQAVARKNGLFLAQVAIAYFHEHSASDVRRCVEEYMMRTCSGGFTELRVRDMVVRLCLHYLYGLRSKRRNVLHRFLGSQEEETAIPLGNAAFFGGSSSSSGFAQNGVNSRGNFVQAGMGGDSSMSSRSGFQNVGANFGNEISISSAHFQESDLAEMFLPLDIVARHLHEYSIKCNLGDNYVVSVFREARLRWPEIAPALLKATRPADAFDAKLEVLQAWLNEVANSPNLGVNNTSVQMLRKCTGAVLEASGILNSIDQQRIHQLAQYVQQL